MAFVTYINLPILFIAIDSDRLILWGNNYYRWYVKSVTLQKSVQTLESQFLVLLIFYPISNIKLTSIISLTITKDRIMCHYSMKFVISYDNVVTGFHLSFACIFSYFFLILEHLSYRPAMFYVKKSTLSLYPWYWRHKDANDPVLMFQHRGMNSQSTIHDILGNVQPLMS